MTAQEYVKSGEHLPVELRDFHDAKLFFKWLVWEKLDKAREKLKAEDQTHSNRMLEGLDFASAQIFTIDYFPWFMGMFGYKLQRVRKSDVEFYDLTAAMKEYQKHLNDTFARELQSLTEEGLKP